LLVAEVLAAIASWPPAQATEKALKGDEHKAFMSECLKAKPMTSRNR
jgi:psiF repeat